MTEQFLNVYVGLDSSYDPFELKHIFNKVGVKLKRPDEGDIYALFDGDKRVVTESWVSEQYRAKKFLHLLYWVDHREYITVGFSFPRDCPNILVNEIGLDALSVTKVLQVLVDLVKLLQNTSVLGFVLDTSGATEEFDWDHFFLNRVFKLGYESPLIDGLKRECLFVKSVEEYVKETQTRLLLPSVLAVPKDALHLESYFKGLTGKSAANLMCYLNSPFEDCSFLDENGALNDCCE